MQSQQAEMVCNDVAASSNVLQTPLRERLAYVSQKAAHLSEQAAAYDAQLHQSTELLVAATTPLKTRASSRLSLASSLASPLAESLPSVAEELSKEASEVEEETAQIIHTNPLVQSMHVKFLCSAYVRFRPSSLDAHERKQCAGACQSIASPRLELRCDKRASQAAKPRQFRSLVSAGR